jgi:hypothetical protein
MQHNPKDPYHQQQCDAEDSESEHGGFFHLFFCKRIPQRRDALMGYNIFARIVFRRSRCEAVFNAVTKLKEIDFANQFNTH